VQAHLRGLQSLMGQAEGFDPATLNMTLRLGMRDVLEAITLPPLMARLGEVAPHVRVSSVRVPRDALEQVLTQGDVDLVIDRQRRVTPRIQGVHLADETLAVIMRRGHPLADQALDAAAYFRHQHVMVTLQPEGPDPLQAVWSSLELTRALPLLLRELPVPVPSLGIWMYWHADRDGDPAHRWMRDSVTAGALQAMHGVHDLG
jgi:DNA-binding transcriptional LysR family regulator